MKMKQKLKMIIKALIKRLLPSSLKIYKSKIREMQQRNQSSLWKAVFYTHFYKSCETLSPCEDYVRQMSKIMSRMDIDVTMHYVYPYDIWFQRGIQYGRYTIVSITVDYVTVLNSSLKELVLKLQGKDDSFIKNEENVICAIRDLTKRIERKLKKEDSERSELLQSYFSHFLDNKPDSFDEALQKILFYNGLFWQANHWHNGLGRLDLILDEYYQNDVKKGILDREHAKQMLKEFVLILGSHTRQKSCVLIGDTGQYILLGGVDQNGNTVQNDLTEIFLEIFTELKRPDPKLILRVNEQTSATIWTKAIDCVLTGCGSPLIMNESLIMKRMQEFGYKKEDVWNVGTSACWEPLIIGKSFDQNNPFPNIPVLKSLNNVIESGIDYKDLDAVVSAIKPLIAQQIKEVVHDIDFDVSPLYSLFFDSCIERGKDYTQGGADYAYHGVQIVSFPNLINALLNLQTYVFGQKIVSLDVCRKAMHCNFEGYEDLRQMLKSNTLMFGSAKPEIVALTNDLMDFISQEVEKYTCNGQKLKVGFSSSQYIMARWNVTASLDGRKDYDPFAVHISPLSQTIDIQEVLNFAGQLKYTDNRLNGNVVDVIVPAAYVKQKDKLCSIIKSVMTSGVYELQLNVLDAVTLKDAKAHPEKYPNLVVRVWGFSAYFNDLPEEYKDNLIARAETNG